MNYQKVSKGDPIQIPAALWNDILTLLQNSKGTSRTTERSKAISENWETVTIKNDTGEAIPAYSALGISGVVTEPPEGHPATTASDKDKLREFLTVTLKARNPIAEDKSRWIVNIDPMEDGSYGKAVVCGIVPMRILSSEDDTHVEIRNDELMPRGGNSGYEIIWQEDGDEEKWAMVRVGLVAKNTGRTCKIISSTQDGGNFRWAYSVKEVKWVGPGQWEWEFTEDAETFGAVNLEEINNGSSGPFGNGANSDGDVTVTLLPIGNDEIVDVKVRSGVAYFSRTNGITVACGGGSGGEGGGDSSGGGGGEETSSGGGGGETSSGGDESSTPESSTPESSTPPSSSGVATSSGSVLESSGGGGSGTGGESSGGGSSEPSASSGGGGGSGGEGPPDPPFSSDGEGGVDCDQCYYIRLDCENGVITYGEYGSPCSEIGLEGTDWTGWIDPSGPGGPVFGYLLVHACEPPYSPPPCSEGTDGGSFLTGGAGTNTTGGG